MSSVAAQDVGDSGNETVLTSTESVAVDQTNDVISTSESTDNVVESNDSSLVNAETQDVVGVNQIESMSNDILINSEIGNNDIVGSSGNDSVLGATSWTVSTETEFKAAYNGYASGDTITITSSFTLSQEYTWKKNVIIKGATNSASNYVLTGTNDTYCRFNVYTDGVNVNISYLTFKGFNYRGSDGGVFGTVMRLQRGNVTISNCIFTECTSYAGMISSGYSADSSVRFDECSFVSNIVSDAAMQYGGGSDSLFYLCANNENPWTFNNCIFRDTYTLGSSTYKNIYTVSFHPVVYLFGCSFDGVSPSLTSVKNINYGDDETITGVYPTNDGTNLRLTSLIINDAIITGTFNSSSNIFNSIHSNLTSGWYTVTGLSNSAGTCKYLFSNPKIFYVFSEGNVWFVGSEEELKTANRGYENGAVIKITGSFTVTQMYYWTKKVTIQGNLNSAESYIITGTSGVNSKFIVADSSNANVSVSHLTFSGFDTGQNLFGSVMRVGSGAYLKVSNCIFKNCTSDYGIIGLGNQPNNILNVSSCSFINCTYNHYDLIYADGYPDDITTGNCTYVNTTWFVDSESELKKAYSEYSSNDIIRITESFTISQQYEWTKNVIIRGDTDSASSYVLTATSGTECRFNIHEPYSPTITISYLTFKGFDKAGGNYGTWGSTLRVSGGVVNVSNCIFTECTSNDGGIIAVREDAVVTFTSCNFISNTQCLSMKTLIYLHKDINYDADVVFDNCIFINTTGTSVYKNIYNTGVAVTVKECTFDGNSPSFTNIPNDGSTTMSGKYLDGTNLNLVYTGVEFTGSSSVSKTISINSNSYSASVGAFTSNGIYNISKVTGPNGNSIIFSSPSRFGVGNFYISPSGSDSAIGTSSNPTNYDTAISYIYDGGTILFKTGTYTLNSKTINKNVNLVGESSTIQNYKITGIDPFTVTGGTVKFQYLTFTSCTSTISTKSAITVIGGSVTITNCVFTGNSNSANNYYRNIYNNGGAVVLSDSIMDYTVNINNPSNIGSDSNTVNGTFDDGTNLKDLTVSINGPTQSSYLISTHNNGVFSVTFSSLNNGIYTVSLSCNYTTLSYSNKKFGVGNLYINPSGGDSALGTSFDPTNYDTAINYIYDGGIIYFASGVYSLNGKNINQNVTLTGITSVGDYNITGTKPLTINGGNVKLQYLTFTGSVTALTVNGGSVELDNCLFIDNTATTGYRNLYAYDTSKITLNDCVFDVNESTLNKADIFANQTGHINGTVNHGTNLGNLIPYTSVFKLLLNDTELTSVTFDGTYYSYDINNLDVKDGYKIVLQSVAGLRVLQSTLYSVFKY